MSGRQSTSIALLDANSLRASCCPRSTTATRRGCTPSRSARASRELELSPEENEAIRLRARGRRRSAAASRVRLLEPQPTMRVAYFGPEGTFTQEALIAATASGAELDAGPASRRSTTP